MKKFITYIFAFICLLSAGLFAACSQEGGNKDAGIYFNESYLELVVGDQLDLASHLYYENIELKDIKFTSLDTSILVISDGKVTAVGAGTTLVRAESTYTASNLEIKVKEAVKDVGVPTGLIYDLKGQCISWNHVLVKVGNKIQEVNSYTISIATEGLTKEITVTGANQYTINEGGNFTIQVKCNPLVMDGVTIYGGSKYSEPITVRQLSKPTNIQYDDSTNVLSWDCGSDVESFQVKINGVLYQSTKQNQFVIDLSSKDSTSQQQVYKVSVVSEKAVGQKEGDVVAKAESDSVTYTRLYAPTLNIDQGVVTWDNTQKGNFHYELVATNSSGTQFTIPIQNNQFSATQLSTGTYSQIAIRAIGDDVSFLDSINDSKIENIVKLAPATISYNPVTQVITASNHDNRTVELHITYKNTTERIKLPKPSYQYTWKKTEVGEYSLLAYVYADDNTITEINSEASNKLTLNQLAQVDNVTVTQRAENGKYYLEHQTVENATLYEYVIKNGDEETYVLKQQDGSLGNVDKLFDSVGTYAVEITASSTQNLGTNTFILPSRTSVSVIRQADIATLTYNNNNLNWSAVSTANSYSYYANKNGNPLVEVTTTTANSYSTLNLTYGEYKFFVKANGWSNANVLYLDSLHYAEVTFSIAYTLETPELAFDRTTHIATFNKVDHALDYIVTLNEDFELSYYEYEGKLAVNLLNKLNEVGDYVVQVQAVNNDDELILSSSKERITITRLAAPTTFNLSADGILKTTNVPSSTMLDATTPQILTINNQNVKILDKTSSAYVVRAQYIANTQRVGDNYYLDSDTSTFTISRLSTPIKPELNETVVSWLEMKEKNFEYRINVTQNEISRTIALTENQIDVFDIKLGSINLSSDFTISVGYEFKGSDIDLSESRDIKYTSFYSDATLIHKIKSDVKMYISETSAATTVNWEQSDDVQNATYQLFLDGAPIYEGNANSYDLTESIMNEKDYTLRLKISKAGYLDSEYVEIHLERLEAVTKLRIDESENIFVTTDYQPTQLESIKITKDGQDITNLAAFGGKFEVKVQLIARTYTEGEYYYLSSKVSTFNFTRISTLSQPLVDDNAIAWDSINGVEDFRLAFGAGEKEELLPLSNQNIIPVTNNGIKKIFKSLASNEMTVKVQAVIGAFDALKDSEYLLSSYYSETSRITLLQAAQNIRIESNTDDVYQQDVRISWDFDFTGVKVKQTDIDIYHNNRVIAQESITGTATSIVSENMREPGKYFVKIRILGDSYCIDSELVTSLAVTRLEAPTDLSIDQNSVFKWNGVNNATSYNVSYFFNDQIKGELNNITQTKWDLSREMYNDKFGGYITFNVIAVGGQGKDEYRTLSSPMSQEYVVTKLTQGSIRLYSDKFIAGAEIADEFDSRSKYLVTITNNGRIVLNEEFDYNETHVFSDFVYQDTNEKVDTQIEQDFVITVQRVNYNNGFIKSDIVERQVVKLKQPENLGFVRKSDGIDSKIWLQCNIDANAIGYLLTVNDKTYSDFGEIGLIAEIPLVDELYNKIAAGDVEFKINKKGFILETGISYIDSAQTTITARKLETPNGFGSNNGVISWNMVDRATDYLIKVNNTEILSGYIVDDVHTLVENFEGRAGDLSLNIKAKGNVGTTVMSTNVILDSSYILETKNGESEIKDYQCRKLNVPGNFRGVNGYLAITENADDKKNSQVKYQAIIENTYYDLRVVGNYDGKTYALLYSDDMYQSLQDDTKYLVRVRAISSKPEIVYSELSTSIYVKIIPNTIRGTLEFSLKKISEDPVKYDYSKSQVNWAEAVNATNGYKVIINSTEFETNLTTYDLETDDFKVSPVVKNEVKILIKGDSFLDEDGCYKLDSRATEPLDFYKLASPAPKVEDGKLAWSKVNGATGYLIYLDNSLLYQDPINATTASVDLGDIGGNIVYAKYEVKAVSTDPKFIASEPGLYRDDLNKAKAVTKLHAPFAFTVEDGVLKWELTDEAMMNFIWGRVVDNPFTFDMHMIEKFFNEGIGAEDHILNEGGIDDGVDGGDGEEGDDGEEGKEEFDIYEFIAQSNLYIEIKFVNNDTQVETILRLNPMLFLTFNKEYEQEALALRLVGAGGWPTVSYEYDDGNWNPECGSYTYYLRQPGDDVEYLESNFSMPQDLYIPFSPQIKITYKTNLYTLKWDPISIPEYYNMPNPTYQVIVEATDGKRAVIAETTGTSVNLTELIENGTLGAEHKKLYVVVKGNSRNVLNGKKSNIITLEVLDAIDAYVKDGKIQWAPQEAAGEYIITYTEANRPDTKKVLTKTELFWNCEELSSSVDYYDVTINAVGQTITTYTHATLTGQTTSIGKIRKLKDPIVEVDNGVFKWKSIDNCENYSVYITQPESELERIRIPALDIGGYIWYESTYSTQNTYYQFRAMGELDKILDENSDSYVNSDLLDDVGIYGSVLKSVYNIRAEGGQLVWDIVKNGELFVNYYKLTFNKVNDEGIVIDSKQVITGGNFRKSADSGVCVYGAENEVAPGKYKVVIQAYYATSQDERRYPYEGVAAYHLIGLVESDCYFEKYNVVEGFDIDGTIIENNLSILDGEFKWQYSGEYDPSNYNYELKFTSNLGESIVHIIENPNFIDNIVEQLTPTETYELRIRVVPKDGVDGFVNSDYIMFKNINDYDRTAIYQVNAIKEKDLTLKRLGANDDIYISWEDYKLGAGEIDLSSSTLEVKYKLTYWTQQDGADESEKQSIITNNKYYNTVDMSFNITENYTLFYTIQVLPLGLLSYIPSCESEVRDIKKPNSVDSVAFDPVSQTFSWIADATTADHCFKVKDEILKTDAEGNLVLDADGQPIVLRTYIFTTQDNKTTQFVPLEQGWHRVSVAVAIRTSSNESGLDSEYKYYQAGGGDGEEEIGTPVLINLFEVSNTDKTVFGANGTSDNPYIINTAEQFANIAHRLEKPSYQNSYYITIDGKTEKFELPDGSVDYLYHFKQNSNIYNVEPFAKNDLNPVFNGIYDGCYYTLTWKCDFDAHSATNALFYELSNAAIVKNVKIGANFIGTLAIGSTISMVCQINNGTIYNVIVGNIGDTIELNHNDAIYWNGVCNLNNGLIEKVVNYYNVTLAATRVGYSGITSFNYEPGKIIECANYGNIKLETSSSTSGGIVGTNYSTISRSVLKNSDVIINILKTGTAGIRFGGIVGTNKSSGGIESSYVNVTAMKVHRESNNGESVYVAGLVGYSESNKISRSYVSVAIEATKESEDIEIGKIYIFAFINSSGANANTYCYSNIGLHSAIGGTTNFTVTTYTDKPYGSNMNDDNQYYANNENTMPVLTWEDLFVRDWKANTPKEN